LNLDNLRIFGFNSNMLRKGVWRGAFSRFCKMLWDSGQVSSPCCLAVWPDWKTWWCLSCRGLGTCRAFLEHVSGVKASEGRRDDSLSRFVSKCEVDV